MRIMHGGDRYGRKQEIIYDFSTNVNPFGMPERIKAAVIAGIDDFANYPDASYGQLREAVAMVEGVPKEQILCGNGASELLFASVLAVRPRQALLPVPSFGEYERALNAADTNIYYVNLNNPLESPSLSRDLKRKFRLDEKLWKEIMLPELEDKDMLILGLPNNPTGQGISAALLEVILQECKMLNCRVLIDACFLELMTGQEAYDMAELLNRYENLAVLKAFTKTYAMAGLRFGYLLCSDPVLVERVYSFLPPWNVSYPAMIGALAATEEKDYPAYSRKRIAVERAWLAKRLGVLGFIVYPSDTNFLLFCIGDLGNEVPAEIDLKEALIPYGILIRDCSNFRGLEKGFYRVAVRTRMENEALLSALKKVIGGILSIV